MLCCVSAGGPSWRSGGAQRAQRPNTAGTAGAHNGHSDRSEGHSGRSGAAQRAQRGVTASTAGRHSRHSGAAQPAQRGGTAGTAGRHSRHSGAAQRAQFWFNYSFCVRKGEAGTAGGARGHSGRNGGAQRAQRGGTAGTRWGSFKVQATLGFLQSSSNFGVPAATVGRRFGQSRALSHAEATRCKEGRRSHEERGDTPAGGT